MAKPPDGARNDQEPITPLKEKLGTFEDQEKLEPNKGVYATIDIYTWG